MADIAVIKTGGKQYKVKLNDELLIEKIDAKKGQKIEFDDILAGKKVAAVVIEDAVKGEKINILKFKPKTRSIRRMGHRQQYFKIKIEGIK